jgi:hypothetical protein
VNALVAEAGSRMRDLPDAQPQRRLILGRALAVEASARESRQPTSSHRGHLKALCSATMILTG